MTCTQLLRDAVEQVMAMDLPSAEKELLVSLAMCSHTDVPPHPHEDKILRGSCTGHSIAPAACDATPRPFPPHPCATPWISKSDPTPRLAQAQLCPRGASAWALARGDRRPDYAF